MPRTLIGHLDADSFYVSAERVRDPWLNGKPVAVLGNNGACVIARSYEMRDYNVRVGEPIWDAVGRCPEGIYVKRDFQWYEVLSRQMLDITQVFSPCVEYYSIDELFFTAESRPHLSMQEMAVQMRDTIKERVKLPVTVGIARTRTLAKLLSDNSKPFGARVLLDRDEEEQFLAERPVTDICGIAARRLARLAPYNIRTCLDLARARRSLVKQLLTVVGERIWRELNGEPAIALEAHRRPHQTLSRGGSIGWATDDRLHLHGWLVRNLERMIEELEFHQVWVGRVEIWLGFKDGPYGVGEARLPSPTDRFDLLMDAFREAFGQAYRPGERVSRMHLIATHLHDRRCPVQRTLFEKPDEGGRQAKLAQLKREVGSKVGRFALRSGATLPLKPVYNDVSNEYDICDVHGKTCF